MDDLSVILPFLAAAVILVLRKYCSALWEKIHLPFLIVLSLLSAVIVCIMLLAAYTMLQKTAFSPAEKILYCAVIAGLIGLFLWINIANWKKWRDGRKAR